MTMTLKPAAWMCPKCEQACDAKHEGSRCTWCGLESRFTVPLFTRDDLVRVAERAREGADVETLTQFYEVVGHRVHWYQDSEHIVREMLGEVEKP